LSNLLTDCEKNNTLLIVDEAYMEFANEKNSLATQVSLHDNLIVLRTMSKLYSMTTDKVGYILTSPKIKSVLEPDCDIVSDNAKKIAAGILLGNNTLAIANDVILRRNALKFMLSLHECDCIDSSANFIMAKSLKKNLHNDLFSRGINTVDLDNHPGLEGLGYCRIGVPSYDGLRTLARRLYNGNN